ncbi:MAG: 16S rRNA (cytosine(967)-C(5))-methyltransferase RsmB [Clostridia bacterium]|nr:16S rRNA (cytosine(967)-C(5))-methyltransferase RsmB [Clostridia bacterium]
MADLARKAAYDALMRVEKDGAFSNLAMSKLRELSALDASFATALCMGVLEKRRALDFLIMRHTQKTPDKELLLLLRLGAFQIFYMDRVPDSASCNETVAIARGLFGSKRAGFVNAVLRSLCREKEAAWAALQEQPAEIRLSFGDGVGAIFREQYPDNYTQIMEAFCEKQPLRLRVNNLKTDAHALAARLDAAADGNMLTVLDRQSEAVRGLDSGEYFVQGYGSQMAVRMLGAQAGDTVFDVCACPGGKSLGAALDMQNRGLVRSMDIHGNKLPLIKKSAEKLGISIIETAVHDARETDPLLVGKADKVICDVPCSGLGVIGSKPEIRYKDPAEFAGLYPTQRKILASSANYVKPGGTLVYSTCTLNKIENEEIVRGFLAEHDDFSLADEHTFLPFDGSGEGFYAAKLVRKA